MTQLQPNISPRTDHIKFQVITLDVIDPDDALERQVLALIAAGNWPLAELRLRDFLENNPPTAKVLNFLGCIAGAVNQPHFAAGYFRAAATLAPGWQPPLANLSFLEAAGKLFLERTLASPMPADPKGEERFLLIKSWGYGFWSDVFHVLGQLLLAEVSGRIPVVHWGDNCLFGDGSGANAFEFFFEPVSGVAVEELQGRCRSYWPPKWRADNLSAGEINKLSGAFSRQAGLYLLGRPEQVVVADFFLQTIELIPWIPEEHHLYGMSSDELYEYAINKYLRPRSNIMEKVQKFYRENLNGKKSIAVHVRGSDKIIEVHDLHGLNQSYAESIAVLMAKHMCSHVYLMTDDVNILQHFRALYGEKIITTSSSRTATNQGIHYQGKVSGRCLGEEVMVDTYLATKAEAFIGNGLSNPSVMASYLKEWDAGACVLLRRNLYHQRNPFIYGG